MFEGSQALPDFPYARYAEMLGLEGFRVDDPDQIGKAWDEALHASKPAVLEVVTDPDVPPLPPHVKFEQAKSLMFALAKGDPRIEGVVKQGFLGKAREFLSDKGEE